MNDGYRDAVEVIEALGADPALAWDVEKEAAEAVAFVSRGLEGRCYDGQTYAFALSFARTLDVDTGRLLLSEGASLSARDRWFVEASKGAGDGLVAARESVTRRRSDAKTEPVAATVGRWPSNPEPISVEQIRRDIVAAFAAVREG